MKKSNPFLDHTLPALPRLMSLLNRNKLSPFYGSFDRDYWHYRTVTDFSSPTYQQGVLCLAQLYSDKIFGETYYQNEIIRDYALAGIKYWQSLQHNDGSFDEWFPNEYSHVSTAFTTYAISEACIDLEISDADIMDSLLRSGTWLSHNFDRKVLNHTAGAVAALANIAKLTDDAQMQKGFADNISIMEEFQNDEGWFYENGCFDTSYLTVSIDYLVKADDRVGGNQRIRCCLEKALDFMKYLVYPDGTVGRPIGNRNTQYIMPYGLLRYARESAKAKTIISRYLGALANDRAITPMTTDDRYFLFFFLPNFLQCAREQNVHGVEPEQPDSNDKPLFDDEYRRFEDAGLIVRRHENTTFYMNYKKGGVYRYYKDSKLSAADSGYFVRQTNGNILTSSLLVSQDEVQFDNNQNLRIASTFKSVNYSVPFKYLFLPFRVFNFTLGFVPAFAEKLTEYIKLLFIRQRKESPYSFSRDVSFESDGSIRIQDDLTSFDESGAEVIREIAGTAMHVPTSRYFLESDLCDEAISVSGKVETILK
ncbi:MAG: hypothetical protein JKX97_04945 [Candidatus Lindowbacteria bacterium]|nr:hypothetical protein [Candidatus Lindowbacteria bacterium]